jgi:hypothetical protein
MLVALSGTTAPTVTLRSPSGTTWTVHAQGFYNNRVDFLGEPAGGEWLLTVSDTTGTPHLTEFTLLVSNDVDSRQIYNFYALYPYPHGGTPDLVEAQRQFQRTALAHLRPLVTQRTTCIVDDPQSLVGVNPVGV